MSDEEGGERASQAPAASEKDSPGCSLILFPLLILLGIVFYFAAKTSYPSAAGTPPDRFLSENRRVRGLVTRLSSYMTGGRSSTRVYEVSYRYQAGGKSLSGESSVPGSLYKALEVGGEITVFYLQESPGDSILAPESKVQGGKRSLIVSAVMVVVGLIGTCISLAKLIAWNRSQTLSS